MKLNRMGYAGLDLGLLRSQFRQWQERPIEIEIRQGDTWTSTESVIIFRDFGVGLAIERVKRIWSKYFSSTKRETNAFIGAFGLGSKSPLGYTDLFDVVTRFQGVKYHFTIHKGQKAPRIELLHKEETDEGNGTEVIVPIKSGDVASFKRAVKEQLAYFDGLKFIGCDLDGDYTLYRGEHFLYHSGRPFQQMHLVLGKVYYPVNFNVIAIPYQAQQVPIGLRFEIGELDVVWNREAVEYTDKTKKAIMARYQEARKEIEEIARAQSDSIETMEEFLQAYYARRSNRVPLTERVSLYTGGWIEVKATYPKYKSLSLPYDPLAFWTITHSVEYGKVVSKRNRTSDYVRDIWREEGHYFTADGVSAYKKNQYIYHELEKDDFYIIAPANRRKEEVRALFSLPTHREIEPEKAKLIREFIGEVDDVIVSRFENYDDVVIPDDWKVPAPPPKAKKAKPTGQVHAKTLRIYDANPTFISEDLQMKDLVGFKGPIVYSTYADAEHLEDAARLALFSRRFGEESRINDYHPMRRSILFLKLSKANIELLTEQRPSAVEAKPFITETMTLRRALAARAIRAWFKEHLNQLWVSPAQWSLFGEEFQEAMKKIVAFYNKHYNDGLRQWTENTILAYLTKYVEQPDVLTDDIKPYFDVVRGTLLKYPFFQYFDLSRTPDYILRQYIETEGKVSPRLYARLADHKAREAERIAALSAAQDEVEEEEKTLAPAP